MESERQAGTPMSTSNHRLGPGDAVFHPKYGFGTVHSLTRRDRVHPIHEPTAADANSERTEDYYDIALVEGGTLLVPVSRADSVGLRRLSNGIAAVTASLSSPAQDLPANPRERAAVLRMREQLAEPEALAHSVRDMLAQSNGRNLSAGEQTWLDKACQRLSAEVALVDHISVSAAKSAIWEVVAQLGVKAKIA
jgi:RNA polymerase-interacting CarD/CdnL/TRCF family regulator